MPALLLGHAAVAGGGRSAGDRGAASERLLCLGGERSEAHPGDGDRDFQFDRLLREARAEDDVRAATLAVAFERIARDRGAEEQQIVEVRQLALRAAAADVVDAGDRRAADLRQRVVVEGGGGPRRGRRVLVGHGCISIRIGIVDIEVVEFSRRAVAPEVGGLAPRCRPRRAGARRFRSCSGRIFFSMQSAPRLFTLPRTKSRAS